MQLETNAACTVARRANDSADGGDIPARDPGSRLSEPVEESVSYWYTRSPTVAGTAMYSCTAF